MLAICRDVGEIPALQAIRVYRRRLRNKFKSPDPRKPFPVAPGASLNGYLSRPPSLIVNGVATREPVLQAFCAKHNESDAVDRW